MREPLFRVRLVCEGPSDVPRARVVLVWWLRAHVPWCDGYADDELLQLCGIGDEEGFIAVRDVPRLAAGRLRSGFGAPLGAGDGGTLRRLLLVLLAAPKDEGRTDMILWLRDGDGDPNREPSARRQQDRTAPLLATPVVVGYAHQCGEAWIVAGFDPSGDHERSLAEEARRRLERAHVDRPWDLSHKEANPRGAKAIALLLTGGAPERERACVEALLAGPPEVLGPLGLERFLNDLGERWGPVLGAAPA
jgi:hypothetical protein